MHAWNQYGIILINQLMLFSCPIMSDSVTPWTAARQASLSLTISRSLAKFTFIASVKPSNHLILWRPLLLLPSILPSIRDFCNELSVCIRWPKYGSFHFGISPFSEYSGLISLKTGLISLLSKEFSGVFSSTTVRRHQFFGILPSLWFSYSNKVKLFIFFKRAQVRIATFLSLSTTMTVEASAQRDPPPHPSWIYSISQNKLVFCWGLKKKQTNIFYIYLVQLKGKSRLSGGNVPQPEAYLSLYCVFSMYTSLNTNQGPAQRRWETF